MTILNVSIAYYLCYICHQDLILPHQAIVLPSGVRVEGSQLPEGRVAVRSHLGGYGGLSETWGAMTEEIGDAGEQSRFPIWEFYVSNPAEVARPSELRTDLVTLLEERAATRA